MNTKGHSEECKYHDHDKMQYAIWKPEEIGFIIDAFEWQYIQEYFEENKELPELEYVESDTRLVIALGTYSFQREREEAPRVELITDYKGGAHMTLTEAGWVLMELVDVVLHGEVGDLDVPISALIRTSLVLPSSNEKDMAMTVFLKYGDLKPVDNIINRSGHFSFKDSIESDAITDKNWLDFVKIEDVMKAHEYIWTGEDEDEGVCE